MNINEKRLSDYCNAHTSKPSEVLYQLERETYLKTLAPQMIAGSLQGRFLSFISQMLKPKTILEIGTFTGYSAICLSEGLAEGGKIHTIEANPEMETIIRKYFKKAGVEHKIELHIGKAQDIIPDLQVNFDLVFIDAGKMEYELFYDLVFDKLVPGGYLMADNVLWSGKVLNDPGEMDMDTQAIDAFNKKIQADERVENVLLPIRDGITLIRKV